MQPDIPAEVMGPYVGSNVFAITTVLIAWLWPRAGRGLFAAMFLAASLVNAWLALTQPTAYLAFATGAIGWYRDFVNGPFSQNPALFVLAIAAGQLGVAACLVIGRQLLRWGVLGGTLFLLAIAPLGYTGSAFPSTLIMALGLLLVLVRSNAVSSAADRPAHARGARP